MDRTQGSRGYLHSLAVLFALLGGLLAVSTSGLAEAAWDGTQQIVPGDQA